MLDFVSAPDYLDSDEELSVPVSGEANRSTAAFDSEYGERIEEVLRKPSDDEGGYSSASQRHVDLAKALGIPDTWINLGFNGLSQGELPPGLSQEGLTKVEQERNGGSGKLIETGRGDFYPHSN